MHVVKVCLDLLFAWPEFFLYIEKVQVIIIIFLEKIVYMNKGDKKLSCFLSLLRITFPNYVGDMKKIVILTNSFPDHTVSIIKKRGMYTFWHNIIEDSISTCRLASGY